MSVTMGYKMTHDNGFAPNPFHGVLTLATCKPKIRACRQVGEWVAGFAAQALVKKAARLGVHIPCGGLVYLMQIGEVLPLHMYFDDPRFMIKRPSPESSNPIVRCGDNIYYHDHRGEYAQITNEFHGQSGMFHDINGLNALIARRFYYFGRNCFVPDGGWATIATGAYPSRGRTFYCPDRFAESLLRYFDSKNIAEGMYGLPVLMADTLLSVQCGSLTSSARGRKAYGRSQSTSCSR